MNNDLVALLQQYDRLFKEQRAFNENLAKTLDIQDRQIEFLRKKLFEADKQLADIRHELKIPPR